MHRSRLLVLLGLVAAGFVAGRLALGDEPKQPPQRDPEEIFKLGDTNKDGKLSKDEFKKLVGNRPRFKDNPEIIDRVFDRLDTNKDGFLSLEEFKKFGTLGGNQPKPAEQPKPVE